MALDPDKRSKAASKKDDDDERTPQTASKGKSLLARKGKFRMAAQGGGYFKLDANLGCVRIGDEKLTGSFVFNLDLGRSGAGWIDYSDRGALLSEDEDYYDGRKAPKDVSWSMFGPAAVPYPIAELDGAVIPEFTLNIGSKAVQEAFEELVAEFLESVEDGDATPVAVVAVTGWHRAEWSRSREINVPSLELIDAVASIEDVSEQVEVAA